jgi:DHA1 family multidrug resistance protein-like MFS transporter
LAWRRNQFAVTAAAFIGFTGFTLVMPFLPLYFAELGVRDAGTIALWSGFSLGVTPAVTAAMAPIWARVADRYGRKLMVARSLVSFVVIMTAMAFVQAPWQVFALRVIQGLFAGYGPIAMTMAAESAPPEHTAAAIGWVQTAQRLGPALGPLIGGTLAQGLGIRRTFLVSALFYLVGFLVVVVLYRETQRQTDNDKPPATTTFRALARIPHFLLFMTTVFVLQLVDRSFGPILPLYLQEIGLAAADAPFMAGVIFTVTAAAAALGNQLTRQLLRRTTPRVLVPMMAGVGGLAAFVFGLGPPLAALVATAILFGFALGVATTTVYAAATEAVPPVSRGVAFGYLTTAYLVGLAVSPMAAGLLGSLSMRAVFLADAVGLGILTWLVRRRMTEGRRAVPQN